MRKTVVLVSCFFIANTFAQKSFYGKATYKTHRKMDLKINDSKGTPNSDVQKQLQEQLRKMFQKTYTLQFTKFE